MPFKLPKRVLTPANCCTPYFQKQRLGIIPDPDTPTEPNHLYTTQFVGTWNNDTPIQINGISGTLSLVSDVQSILDSIFGVGNSGYIAEPGFANVSLWVYATSEPVLDVLVDGNPLVLTWSDIGTDLPVLCYDVTFNLTDPTATIPLTQQLFNLNSGYINPSGAFDDPDALKVLLTPIYLQMFGAGSSFSLIDLGSGDFRVVVLNTIIAPTKFIVQDLNTSGTQSFDFSEISCT